MCRGVWGVYKSGLSEPKVPITKASLKLHLVTHTVLSMVFWETILRVCTSSWDYSHINDTKINTSAY